VARPLPARAPQQPRGPRAHPSLSKKKIKGEKNNKIKLKITNQKKEITRKENKTNKKKKRNRKNLKSQKISKCLTKRKRYKKKEQNKLTNSQ
jgi:hypothetical protein